ncbi:hypothetical protein ABKN59_004689 [Abortiporus biennis]
MRRYLSYQRDDRRPLSTTFLIGVGVGRCLSRLYLPFFETQKDSPTLSIMINLGRFCVPTNITPRSKAPLPSIQNQTYETAGSLMGVLKETRKTRIGSSESLSLLTQQELVAFYISTLWQASYDLTVVSTTGCNIGISYQTIKCSSSSIDLDLRGLGSGSLHVVSFEHSNRLHSSSGQGMESSWDT